MTKNPNSDFWRTIVFDVPAYSLDDLADYVNLSSRPVFYYSNEVVEGRNCDLFRQIKQIGYREVLQFKKSGKKLDYFNQYLLSLLEGLNQKQQPPLSYSELRGIAKSASRWIWERFDQSQFNRIQANRAKKRWKNQQEKKQIFIEKFGDNMPDLTLKQISQQVDVSLSTIYRWAKELGWKSKKDQDTKYQKILRLRNNGITWYEIAKRLSITEASAKMFFKRYQSKIKKPSKA